jgi:non-specific protein-tyrosine kinase
VLLATLRRRWRVALMVFAITVGTTFFLTMQRSPRYAASAQILLQPSDGVSQVLSPGVVPSPASAQRDIDTNTALITATPVMETVRRDLGLSMSNRELASKIDVSGQDVSNLVSITARDESARQAARIATAVALGYAKYRRIAARDAIRQSVATGTSRMLQLERTAGSAAERLALRDRLIQLRTSEAIGIDPPQVIRRASVPPSPSSPSLLLPIAAGLLGVMLAIGAALAVDQVDKRLLRLEDAETAFGVPVLLSLLTPRRSGRDHLDSADKVDAYASLAARLALNRPDDRARVLMISSTGPRDVRCTVATDLARQLSAFGLRVVHVEANLRPASAESNGRGERPYGLSAVLQGRASVSGAMRRHRRAGGAARVDDQGDVRPWRTLPAGTPVASPSRLLGRPEFASVVSYVRADTDFVLLDGPAATMPEALPVAAASDGILLVVPVPDTTRDHSAAVRHALGPLYSKVIGLALCAAPRRRIRPGLPRTWSPPDWRSWRTAVDLIKVPPSGSRRDSSRRRREGTSRTGAGERSAGRRVPKKDEKHPTGAIAGSK